MNCWNWSLTMYHLSSLIKSTPRLSYCSNKATFVIGLNNFVIIVWLTLQYPWLSLSGTRNTMTFTKFSFIFKAWNIQISFTCWPILDFVFALHNNIIKWLSLQYLCRVDSPILVKPISAGIRPCYLPLSATRRFIVLTDVSIGDFPTKTESSAVVVIPDTKIFKWFSSKATPELKKNLLYRELVYIEKRLMATDSLSGAI